MYFPPFFAFSLPPTKSVGTRHAQSPIGGVLFWLIDYFSIQRPRRPSFLLTRSFGVCFFFISHLHVLFPSVVAFFFLFFFFGAFLLDALSLPPHSSELNFSINAFYFLIFNQFLLLLLLLLVPVRNRRCPAIHSQRKKKKINRRFTTSFLAVAGEKFDEKFVFFLVKFWKKKCCSTHGHALNLVRAEPF